MSEQNIPGTGGLIIPAITEDGRQEVLPRPQRVDLPWPNYWSDFGDDLNASDSGIGTGQELYIEASNPGDVQIEWQYNAPVQAKGGKAWLITPFDKRDLVTVDIVSPASPVTPGGALNCVLVEVAPGSGMHIIVPVPPGSGTHEVDLTAKIGTSNVTVVSPVTAYDGNGGTHNGYFDYDIETGEVTVNDTQEGNANLFDFEMVLTRYLNRVRVTAESDFPGDKARMIYPQWIWRATLTQGGDAGREVKIVCRLLLFREDSF